MILTISLILMWVLTACTFVFKDHPRLQYILMLLILVIAVVAIILILRTT